MDYGYVNARIRGMKGRLLDRKALDELILKPDLDSLIAALEKTPYKEDIEAAGIKYDGIYRIEYALRENFTRTFNKILGFMDEEGERYLKVFLRQWDVQNIKTILRGKSIHATSDEILECMLPVGGLDEATLAEMIRQPDVKAVIDLMATWRVEYARPLTRAFSRYNEEKDLIILESALDRYYYDSAMGGIGKDTYNDKVTRGLLATQIDVINIKTALRLVRDRIGEEDAKRFFIDGGNRLDLEFLLSLIGSRSIEGALKLLESTRYDFLKCAPEECAKKEKVSELEKMLDRYMILKGVSTSSGDPLSIAIPIGYFWAKHNEVTNLRIISRCKTVDMSEEQVKEELIYA